MQVPKQYTQRALRTSGGDGKEVDVPLPVTPIRVGDVVRLKKPHPCGANEWEITRTGMDVGLACVACGRKVRLVRYEFDRRFKAYISRTVESPSDEGRD